jgi:hypothetical protein
VCVTEQYYFIFRVNIARELDLYFFFAMVHIPIRNVDAFIKRIAVA